MAREQLDLQQISMEGLQTAFDPANADGHYFENDGRVYLHAKNTNAATRDVTVISSATQKGLDIEDPVVTIPALTGDVKLGPYDPTLFNQAGGVVHVNVSATAGLTIAAVRM